MFIFFVHLYKYMSKVDTSDRLLFLMKQYDVFDSDELEEKIFLLKNSNYELELLNDINNEIIAIRSELIKENGKKVVKISVADTIFYNMLDSDPTDNKICLQWMLNVFSRYIKSNKEKDWELAKQFASEDLPKAKKYLILFEANKRKQKFKNLCSINNKSNGITDPTNINQYKSLAQLFDAVDPFIEREPSSLERLMYRYFELGEADIPVEDRNYIVYIPKTRDASVIFSSFANWCTAVEGNGNFKNYTTNYKRPNGENSKIYIIVNKNFFENGGNGLYQIHFETSQFKDRRNSLNINFYNEILKKSDRLSDFFREELVVLAKQYNSIDSNKYLDFLLDYGFTETLFDLISEDTPEIKIITKKITNLPDLSKFKKLDSLIIINAGLEELNKSVGELEDLELLVLTNNNLTKLPKEVSNLKKLVFINLYGNKINEIPDEIKYLDKSNGGSLYRLAIDVNNIKAEIYNKLKELLPETIIN